MVSAHTAVPALCTSMSTRSSHRACLCPSEDHVLSPSPASRDWRFSRCLRTKQLPSNLLSIMLVFDGSNGLPLCRVQLSSHPCPAGKVPAPPFNTGLCLVTCFGQWDVSRHLSEPAWMSRAQLSRQAAPPGV